MLIKKLAIALLKTTKLNIQRKKYLLSKKTRKNASFKLN